MELNKPSMKGMKLRVFNSWEDAARAEAKSDALQQPLDRIREVVALIFRVYGVTQEELNKRTKKLHIRIIRYE